MEIGMDGENKLELFKSYFIGRTDVFAEQQDDGRYFTVKRSFTDTDLSDHLEGRHTYGLYLVTPVVNTCSYIVLDIDSLDAMIVKNIMDTILRVGIKRNQILCESSGRRGYHLWLFFNEPVAARKARELSRLIVALSGTNQRVEVFPKQDRVSEDGYGNPIKLPFGIHKQSGNRSRLLDDDLKPIEWEANLNLIKRISLSQLDKILIEFSSTQTKCSSVSSITNRGTLPCVSKIMQGVPEGIRNVCCFKLALHLKHSGMPSDIANIILNEWNKKNSPPLLGKEVESIVVSAYKEDYVGYFCDRDEIAEFCESSCPIFRRNGDVSDTQKQFASPRRLSSFMQIEFPDRDGYWGNILEKKSRMIICGKGKIGKSFFSINFGIALACARPFLNISITKKTKTLYLQQEISEVSLQKRFNQVLKGWDLNAGDVDGLSCHTIGGFNIFNKDHFSQLEQWIKEGEFEIVIFDPIYKFHNIEENSAKDVKSLLDRFDELINGLGVTVILVHHQRKQLGETSHQMRGSSVFFDWGDAYVFLNPAKSSGGAIKLSFELRNAEAPDELIIKRDENCLYQILARTGKRQIEVADLISAFKTFAAPQVSQKELVKKILKDKKVSESTVERRIREAKEQGLMKLQQRKSKHRSAIWELC